MGFHRRARQTVLALAVIAAHVFALRVLLILTPARETLEQPVEKPLIVWMVLPREPAAAAAGPALPLPALTAPGGASLPALPLPAPPSLTAPTVDPAQTVLRQYLGCRLQGESGPWTEDKDACAKMLRELPVGPPAPIQQTEEEKQLARKFEHDQKVLESPTLVPCLAGIMINPLCVAVTLLTGGDFIATYAEVPHRSSEPLATGMVGKSGRTP